MYKTVTDYIKNRISEIGRDDHLLAEGEAQSFTSEDVALELRLVLEELKRVELKAVNLIWVNGDGETQAENFGIGDAREEIYFFGRKDWALKKITI